jgi:hypothetical protein
MEIQGKTYCFGSQSALTQFMADPSGNLAKAQAYYHLIELRDYAIEGVRGATGAGPNRPGRCERTEMAN